MGHVLSFMHVDWLVLLLKSFMSQPSMTKMNLSADGLRNIRSVDALYDVGRFFACSRWKKHIAWEKETRNP